MRNHTTTTIALALTLVAVGCNKSGTPPPAPCYPSDTVQCPPAEWLADYDALAARARKYAPPQDIADQMKGTSQRLLAAVPPGFQWDERTRRFVKTVTPPAAQPPAPTPAPTESKK